MEFAPDYLAATVLAACVGGETTAARDQHEMSQGVLKNVKIEEDLVVRELFLLRLSAAIYALHTFFKSAVQSEMREAWGRVFHGLVLRLMGERSEIELNAFIDGVRERHTRYIEALTAPVPGWRQVYNVGKVFSSLCGDDKNAILGCFGAACFGGAMVSVKSVLKDLAAAGAADFITDLDDTLNIN